MKNKNNTLGVVYELRCLVNNVVYIGCTRNYKKRINKHINDLVHCKHYNKRLQLDFNLYGKDNFVFTILAENISMQNIEEVETYYININGRHRRCKDIQ